MTHCAICEYISKFIIFASKSFEQMAKFKDYLSLVRFSHTVFALPFALIAFFYAMTTAEVDLGWALPVKILICMVCARNAAMGFNRWADRHIDAANPRTAGREIPSGRISPASAMIFTVVNAAMFLAAAALINNLTLVLAPVALFIIMSYSYTKRFTAWSHLVLGVSLSIAPVGAYIAVTGTLAIAPILLAGVVMTWVAGFDILYSFQDAAHDKAHNLYSVPARFSKTTARIIGIVLHIVTAYAVLVLGIYGHTGILYWIGAAIFFGLMIVEHLLLSPSHTARIAALFGTLNGLTSLTYALLAILDMYLCGVWADGWL